MPGVISALLAAMLQLTVGLHLAALVTDWRGEVSRGFLFMTAGTAWIVGLLAFGLAGLGRLEGPERWAQAALLATLLLYTAFLASARRQPRLTLGLLALVGGLSALGLGAVNRPSAALGATLTPLAGALSAIALGAGVGGMMLGHWYLNTPRLTSRPLKLLCDLVLVSLVPLTALAVWYLRTDGGAAGPGGLSGLPLWIGAGMVTVFPFAVTVAARACCVDGANRGKSIQAATGLLYLVAAAVLAGGLAGNAVLLGS